jgi:hypothetical protein
MAVRGRGRLAVAYGCALSVCFLLLFYCTCGISSHDLIALAMVINLKFLLAKS